MGAFGLGWARLVTELVSVLFSFLFVILIFIYF